MGQYTIRIDNKGPLYKKLIKLPTAYYRLKEDNNGNGYTIDSHSGTVEIKDINNIKLKWENDKIFLYEGDSALQLNGKNIIIEQEAIIGESKDDIIKELISEKEVLISHEYIGSSPNFGIGLSSYSYEKGALTGVLKFINFYDENDPVLQKIKKETGGLYFTIEDSDADPSKAIYISDKDGKRLSTYDDYQYQYNQNKCDVLTMDEIIDSLTKASNKKQGFTLQKGEKLLDDVYEATIVLNEKPIATLPKIGYHILNDQLVMRNHVTKEEVAIPSDFWYLKVIKFSSDDYKLTFCNILGNGFFEHKKYDSQYSNVSDEYKFISLSCAKKEYNPNLSELFNHQPSFFIAKGAAEADSPGYRLVDVFELTNSGKGRKMATLIDEFGYFDQSGLFRHCDCHEEREYNIYNQAEIDKKYTAIDANSEFCLTKHEDVTLHTIPQELL